MCKSCTTPFDGQYLQQCEACGHPAHEKNCCGVGVIRLVPMITNQHPLWPHLQIQYGKSVGCQCPNEIYD